MKHIILALLVTVASSAFAWPPNRLLEAAKSGAEDEVRIALEKSHIPVDTADKNRRTALIIAATYGREGVVRILLSKGADVHATDRSGATALALATLGGHTQIIRILAQAKTNIDRTDNKGQTALILAIMTLRTDAAELLLNLGANANIADYNGRTALWWAVHAGSYELVRMLLPHCTYETIAQTLASLSPEHFDPFLIEEIKNYRPQWRPTMHKTFSPHTHRSVRTLLLVANRTPQITTGIALLIAQYLGAQNAQGGCSDVTASEIVKDNEDDDLPPAVV